MNLFTVSQTYLDLLDKAADLSAQSGGEISDIMDAEITNASAAIADLVPDVIGDYKNTSAMIDALKAQEESFKARRMSLESRNETNKRFLLLAIPEGSKYNGVCGVVSYRKSAETIIDDASLLPEIYTVKQEPKPLKKEIKTAIAAGVDVPGARVVEKNNIVIK